MPKGYLAFVLHAHLPYVRHPEYDTFLEERWLFEAITETYIPIIKFLDKLIEEHVPFKLTISISPSLLATLFIFPNSSSCVKRNLNVHDMSPISTISLECITGFL
jgi:predicted glycosyl hydrolase (DUF1957 family)